MSLTSDIVVGNCNLRDDVSAFGKSCINETLILLQSLLYQLQLCINVCKKELFHPCIWQGQELQLARTKEEEEEMTISSILTATRGKESIIFPPMI